MDAEAKAAASGELSDTQLEAVAGGEDRGSIFRDAMVGAGGHTDKRAALELRRKRDRALMREAGLF